ncbi:MAG TPA: ATP synthase F1 subunit gamma [Tissierellia bacterium]|nr:ATP synthase F1 subunit gamma [Tissierellia bacterium]
MAQSTREIKRRIRGINNIKQITNAMELVASARLKRARDRLEKTRPYYNAIYENIREVLGELGSINHPYLKPREIKRSLYIVIAADRGLAGGFNSNVNRLAEREMKYIKDRVKVIAVGTKARDYFRLRGYDIMAEFIGITEDPSFKDAKNIGTLALEAYEKGEIDEVKLVYTRFISVISQQPDILRLLPGDSLKADEEKAKRAIIEFEPSLDDVLNYLIPKYIQSVIYGALVESSASQQGARRTAMENATDNAEEMIDELLLTYNRVRQAAITTEITEIVSGAEALR